MIGKIFVAIFHALILVLQAENEEEYLKVKILFRDLSVLHFFFESPCM